MPKPFKKATTLAPFWSTSDKELVRLYHGEVRDVLSQLPEKVVQCVVTSPPYWGLRDYGVEGQLGSEPSPDCGTWAGKLSPDVMYNLIFPILKDQGGKPEFAAKIIVDLLTAAMAKREPCGRCFVCSMVAVFRGVRRILRDDGTVWLNLGDTYASGGKLDTRNDWDAKVGVDNSYARRRTQNSGKMTGVSSGLPSGNLVGVPWRVALALQSDGWVLRQDIIWAKPSPMPESVRNRCTKAHEYIFLLTKGMGYYYDAEAIKEKALQPEGEPTQTGDQKYLELGHTNGHLGTNQGASHRNKRSVWQVSSQGYEGAHFATFPPKLITPCILAGTSEKGACARCGTPWRRVVAEKKLTRERPNDYVKRTGEEGTGNSCPNSVAGVETRTVGWEPGCECGEGVGVVPCLVLDPFIGSGTTCVVSLQHGRRSWGIDLSEKYLNNNAVPRIEGALLETPALSHLTGRLPKRTGGGERLL